MTGSNITPAVEGSKPIRPKIDTLRFMSVDGMPHGTLSIVVGGRQTLFTVDENVLLKAIETAASSLRRLREKK